MNGLRKLTETVYESTDGSFRLRVRKGRNIEAAFVNRPNVWVSTGRRDMKGALDYAQRCARANSLVPRREVPTLGEYAAGFFTRTDAGSIRARNEHFGKTRSAGYYIFCQGRLENYIMPRFGRQRLDMITDVEIERWYSSLDSAKSGRPLAPTTKIKVLYTLDAVMESARREGIIDTNPCTTVERITERTVNPRKPFTLNEIRTMFPNDEDECIRLWGSLKWACYFSVMVDTGFRAGEVAALTRDNIVGNGLFLTSSVDSLTGVVKQSIKTSYRGQKYKTGTLSRFTMSLLERYMDEMPEDQKLMFPNDKGGLLKPETSNKHLKGVLRRLGIPIMGRTQHCIRHFFNTYMLNNLSKDMDTDDVRELMAHTGYRPEYDHRSPLDIVTRLEKVRPIVDRIHEVVS